MEIRNLQETDLPNVIEFVKNCDTLTLERSSIFWLFWRFFRSTSFVALEGERIIGILLGLFDQAEKKSGFIHELGVAVEYRKKGIASSLIDEFEKSVKILGGNKIFLTTFHTNQTAIKFYEKIGFKSHGIILKVDQERIEFSREIFKN